MNALSFGVVLVEAGQAEVSRRAACRREHEHRARLTYRAVRKNLVGVSRIDTRYTQSIVKPVDLLVMLGLLRPGLSADWSFRSLAEELHLPSAAVQRALSRLGETPAYDPARKRVSGSAAEDLLAHAVPFIAPAGLGAPTRGVPTAWAAAPLSERLSADGELPPVWPDAHGEVRGLAVTPLHAAATELARSDSWMYEMLALVDGMRIGDARVRELAGSLLEQRLREGSR
jgi:hypothetical protein